MSKDLIIVESPAKVKTIKKFLGQDYLVEASVGHVRDLPTKSLGVDENNNFQPQYEIIPGKKKIVNKLRATASRANQVFLAPDPDREGEAIAWHIAELIKDKNPNYNRIQFNEITARAVKEALKHPRPLNENLFNSQQARRILDRLVGYKISPILWKKVKRGLSAGRVQSVALRLIVDRERERQKFVPEEYWLFKAKLEAENNKEPSAAPGKNFVAELWKINKKKAHIPSAQKAQELEQEVRKSSFVISELTEKERKKEPKPPFITSTLQQEASTRLNFSAKKTMTVAQRLYEGVDLGDMGTTALITYMRTDSVRIAKEAQEAARAWILENLGQKFCPPKPRNFKTKAAAQDAHEAIRPVDPSLTPDMVKAYLPADHFRLYRLIWQRFMASQMAPARFWDTVVTIKAGNTLWRAKGQRQIFPGFLKIYYANGENQADKELPELKEGQGLNLLELSKEQKFTQPPSRFTEASLVRKLEELGIGRPSTYATIISTLTDRDYVTRQEKQFVPTELGNVVCDLLVKHFPKLMDASFTAAMEKDLDTIALGDKNWVDVLQKFAQEFYPTLEKAQKEMAEVKAGKETDIKCSKCGQTMLIRFGRNGTFLACSGYPECKNTANFTRDESGKIQIIPSEPIELKKVGTCPKCGRDLVEKKARTGSRFIACTGYPECNYTKPFSTHVPCPAPGCPGELVERSSRRGKIFYGCDQYPECTYAVWDFPVERECPECGSKILVKKTTKARGEHLACPEKGCRYWEKIE
ncbi:type I DNA topoisomerase [Desulfohalobiaceae bacterium Ax17]|uniref:type I DNA topoisomerase n=1 Tax=Desulfovulcanus ferrireducens TaxID=2831190 RepID=UPI00207BA01F|nr:type I DNA topoisomerase [Desulfovulcanus ferrireducens]MBT8764170.1 type I DNA topoisomerase [Desulfovulcanus ferrireducens]